MKVAVLADMQTLTNYKITSLFSCMVFTKMFPLER